MTRTATGAPWPQLESVATDAGYLTKKARREFGGRSPLNIPPGYRFARNLGRVIRADRRRPQPGPRRRARAPRPGGQVGAGRPEPRHDGARRVVLSPEQRDARRPCRDHCPFVVARSRQRDSPSHSLPSLRPLLPPSRTPKTVMRRRPKVAQIFSDAFFFGTGLGRCDGSCGARGTCGEGEVRSKWGIGGDVGWVEPSAARRNPPGRPGPAAVQPTGSAGASTGGFHPPYGPVNGCCTPAGSVGG
jgi:hypothetical protein